MAIVSFDKNELIDYIPVADRDSDNPCIVRMRHVPFAVVEKYQAQLVAKMKTTKQADADRVAAIARGIQRQQFIDSVESVSNFSVLRDGKLVEIKTGEELYEAADNALITELIKAMEDAAKLTEGQAKNFKRASGSLSE